MSTLLRERNAAVVAGYEDGATPAELMARFGLTKQQVEGILYRHLPHGRREARGGKNPHLETIRALAAEGKVSAEIAQATGLSRDAVRHLCNRQNITLANAQRRDFWTPETLETLKRLIDAKLTGAEIAEKMGTTLGAVCGMASRYGWRFNGKARKAQEAVKIVRAQTARAKVAKPRAPKVKPVARNPVGNMPTAKPVPLPKLRDDGPGKCTIHTLTPFVCRWPIGDPMADDFTYCGELKANVGPYCEGNRARAYTKPAPVKKRDDKPARRFAA